MAEGGKRLAATELQGQKVDGEKTILIRNSARQMDEAQIKAFTQWANFILKRRNLGVPNSLEKDFQDGILLINMAEILTDVPVKERYNKNPKILVQKIENITIAKEHLKKNGFDSSDIDSQDIARGSSKPLLGLFWLLVSHYHLKDLRSRWQVEGEDQDLDSLQAFLDRAQQEKDSVTPRRRTVDPKAAKAAADFDAKFDEYKAFAMANRIKMDGQNYDDITSLAALRKKRQDLLSVEEMMDLQNLEQYEALAQMWVEVQKLNGKPKHTIAELNALKKANEDAVTKRKAKAAAAEKEIARKEEEAKREEEAKAEQAKIEELKKQKEENERLAAEARRKAEEIRRQAELDALEDARRKAEEQRKRDEEARRKAEQDALEAARRRREEEDRLAEEARRRAEEARRQAEQDALDAARRRREEEERLAEEARKRADEQRRREEESRRRDEEARRKAEQDALDSARRRREEEERLAEEARRAAELARANEEKRLADSRKRAQEADEAARRKREEEERLAEEARRAAEAARLAEEAKLEAAEEARRKAKEARKAEEERLAEARRQAEADRLAEEARRKAEEARFEEEARLAEEYRRKSEDERRKLDEARRKEEERLWEETRRKRLEEERLAEEARKKRIAEEEEARRRAEEARLAHEAHLAELQKKRENEERAIEDARRRAEEERKKAEEAKRKAEEARRRAEEESQRGIEEVKNKGIVHRAPTIEESAKLCKKCSKVIGLSEIVLVDEVDYYHEPCFRCTNCNTEFENVYWEHKNMPYCFPCFAKLEDMFCSKCDRGIKDSKYAHAAGKKWHLECFKCTTCNKVFGKNHYMHPESGPDAKPYCKKHFYESKGLLCARCTKPVGDGDKTSLGKSWHKTCWFCTGCQNPFGADGFFNVEGMPYCPKCKRSRRSTYAPGSSSAKKVADSFAEESSSSTKSKGKAKK
eukprot:TRINITY_DN1029_c0_g1_i2.p1 TRINITY_DN1029_c0_g1~~TRINITY_DN1029_c0_g1_i2.p1  ORF type:complete len:954 (-),score=394.42 TRINITY_DN1029_c0_g1_i2:125-2938(-)